MNRIVGAMIVLFAVLSIGSMAGAEKAKGKINGEAEFKEHCTVCHPDGGNIISAQKTLHRKDLEANNIKTAADVIKTMRKPGPGMTAFDEKAVSEKEAQAIAEYILKTFK